MKLEQQQRMFRSGALAQVSAIAIALLFASSFSSAATPSASPAGAHWQAGFQGKLDAVRVRLGIPGMTAAVLLSDGRIVDFASGVEDSLTGKPMRPEAVMLAGSIGKSIVAATVLSLAEQGELSLDRKISDYIGGEAWFSHLPNAADLTLRVLLTHSSGIPDHAEDPAFLKDWAADPLRRRTPVELLHYVLDKPPLSSAGRGFNYSDTNYIIAGLVIEKVTGRSFYTLAQERILAPLHLMHIVPSDRRDIAGLVPGYLERTNELGWPEKMTDADNRLHYDPAIEWTGGGFASTPAELARWIKLYSTGKAIHLAYVDDLFASVYAAARKDRYGLGLQVLMTSAGKAYAHGGSIPGYLCIAGYFPDRDVALVVMANKSVDFFPYRWLDELGPFTPAR